MTLDTFSARSPRASAGGSRRSIILAVVAIAQLMIVLDASVVIVALPSAQHALHISVPDRQWVVSAYTLAFGSLLLLGGRLVDYLGQRRMFLLGLLGFAGASTLSGLAESGGMLFGARALQGAFAAIMAPAALSILTVTFTEARERARAFGVYGAIAGGGAALGVVLGGTLTQLASWRWTLLINVPIALIAAALGARYLSEGSRRSRHGYDLPGTVSVTAGLFLLVYGFTTAGTAGWAAPETLGLLVGAVALLATFVAVELRAAHPLLPIRIVLDRNRGGAFLTSLLVGSALLGTFLFLTYFFQGTLHYSAIRTGFAFLPFSVGIILGASLASRLLPRSGPRSLMAGGLALAGIGLLWLTQLGVDSSYMAHVLPAVVVVSFGMGCAFVPMNSTALVGVDTADAGVASALVNATQQVGSSLGIALLNTVAASVAASYLAAHARSTSAALTAPVHGYTVGFALSAGLILLAAVIATLAVRAPRGQSSTEDALEPESSAAPELALAGHR